MNIRTKAFETNSSSCHSLQIVIGNCDDDIDQDQDDNVTILPGEFGWGPETFWDAYTKASYCVTMLKYVPEIDDTLLKQVIQKQTKCKKVIIPIIKENENKHYTFENENEEIYAYIDHESVYPQMFIDILTNEEQLQNFIFNRQSILHIDSDG